MPELPQRKVGVIACSGEELPGGLASRLAALKVLEQLRPGQTVTICLPLFLAGGESDRAFARFYPTIAIDGCEQRCAFRATERYSNRPAAGLVVSELAARAGLGALEGLRKLNAAGQQAVELVAAEAAAQVDALLQPQWDRRAGSFEQPEEPAAKDETAATCSCGSGIPVQHIRVGGADTVIVALPLIYKNFHEQGKPADDATAGELLEMVKIYNPIPAAGEDDFRAALLRYYRSYLARSR